MTSSPSNQLIKRMGCDLQYISRRMRQRLHDSVLIVLMPYSPPLAIENPLPLDLRRVLYISLQFHDWNKTHVRKRKRAYHIHDLDLTAVHVSELLIPRAPRTPIVAVVWAAEAEFQVRQLEQVLLAEIPAVGVRSGSFGVTVTPKKRNQALCVKFSGILFRQLNCNNGSILAVATARKILSSRKHFTELVQPVLSASSCICRLTLGTAKLDAYTGRRASCTNTLSMQRPR
jgi:hypothetical protein